MKTFKEFLYENKISKEILKKFGEILFGDFRKKNEKDTPTEKQIFLKIRKFVSGDFQDRSKKEIKKVFDKLIQLKQLYNILQPINSKFFYRSSFINLTPKEIFDFLNKNNFINYKDNLMISKTNNWEYAPKANIQSWTHKINSAINFSDKFFKSLDTTLNKFKIPIIYKTELKDKNLLFDFKFLNKINSDLRYPIENETIRISDISVQTKLIISKNTYKELLTIK